MSSLTWHPLSYQRALIDQGISSHLLRKLIARSPISTQTNIETWCSLIASILIEHYYLGRLDQSKSAASTETET